MAPATSEAIVTSSKGRSNLMNLTQRALRRGATLSLTLGLVVALAACGGGDADSPAASGGGTGGGTVSVVDGNVDLSADNLEFDASTIEAPAGEAFTITITNLEDQPHNVAVLVQEGGDEIARGEVITGPDAEDVVEVPALEPGEYYFLCDVHHEMNGTIVVEG
jgi:plastocyanin